MEKIYFEENIEIYKEKIESIDLQKNVLEDCITFLSKAQYMPEDNYSYMMDWGSFDYEKEMIPNNNIDKIIKISITKCVQLAIQRGISFNKININSWINVVKTGNPKQTNFKKGKEVVLHNHVDLQKMLNSFHPTYTFVYYVQMPNNLSDVDGTLIVEGNSGVRYYHLPDESDLIIMDGYLPHSPNRSPNSTKNRIVIAGNVGFETAKNKKSII